MVAISKYYNWTPMWHILTCVYLYDVYVSLLYVCIAQRSTVYLWKG